MNMEYKIKLTLEVLSTDEVLEKHNLSYWSAERIIVLTYIPCPKQWIDIRPKIGETEKSIEKYKSLFQTVANKPGIFEVVRPIVKISTDGSYEHTVELQPKMERTYEGFQAMKEYVRYFGFNEI